MVGGEVDAVDISEQMDTRRDLAALGPTLLVRCGKLRFPSLVGHTASYSGVREAIQQWVERQRECCAVGCMCRM